MSRRRPHYCGPDGPSACGRCEERVDAIEHDDGGLITEADYDYLESGAWANYVPGFEPKGL